MWLARCCAGQRAVGGDAQKRLVLLTNRSSCTSASRETLGQRAGADDALKGELSN